MNKKLILSIAGASAIAFTGVGTSAISTINVSAATKSFDKTIIGKWTSQNGDKLKIDNSKATLKIKEGKNKGTYNFNIKRHSNNHYDLKASGKRIEGTKNYSIDINNGIITFKYGKNKIIFNNGDINLQEQTTKDNGTANAQTNSASSNVSENSAKTDPQNTTNSVDTSQTCIPASNAMFQDFLRRGIINPDGSATGKSPEEDVETHSYGY